MSRRSRRSCPITITKNDSPPVGNNSALARRPRDYPALLAFVALCLAVGWIGGQVTAPAILDWYPTLAKPSWTPPNAAFPIVWTLLYVVMAISAWLVWRRPDGPSRRPALIAFFIQLALNFLWSMLFFGLRNPFLGLIDIVLLLAAILATILLFRRVSGMAALLLLPYLAWVGYASALNLAIFRLN